MADFNSIEEYAAYVAGLTLSQLQDISIHIDVDKYSDRYFLVRNLIEKRIKAGETGGPLPEEAAESPPLQDLITDSPPRGIKLSRQLFFLLIALGVICSPTLFFIEGIDFRAIVSYLGSLVIYTVIYYGLLRVRNWVPILVLIVAYYELLTLFISFVNPMDITGEALIVVRITGLLLALF